MTNIVFHVGSGGNRNGFGNHLRTLATNGKPIGVVSIGDYGAIDEALQIAIANGVDHTLVYRVVGLDVPNYDALPAVAALEHHYAIQQKLPPEFDKQNVWLAPINEIDKRRSAWLGEFAVAFATMALNWGYKVAMFGWSSGEPEPEHWDLMRGYLELCAANPNRLAIALHEYNYSIENLQDGYPHLIGRFKELFNACDRMGIARPTVHITEFGFTHEEVPEPSVAMPQIEWAHNLYNQYPQIKIATIWYLGSGFGGIANLAQRLIEPVTNFMLNAPQPPVDPPPIVPPPPDPIPQPPPSQQSLRQRLWSASVAEQIVRGITLNPNAALQSAIRQKGMTPVHREISSEGYVIQAGEDVTGTNKRRVFVYKPGVAIWSFLEPQGEPPPPVDDSIDLLPYVRGDGRVYEVRHPSGAQETFQTQSNGDRWKLVKNSNYESFFVRDGFIWRDIDISPGGAPSYDEHPGRDRYYTTKETNQGGARWCKRFMQIGEVYTGSGHRVQFHYKDDCSLSNANSGFAVNRVTLVAKHVSKAWNNIRVNDVVELRTNTGETMYFAKGYGLVAWQADWGQSAICEEHATGSRDDLQPEVIPCLA